MKALALVYFLLASISVYTNAADQLDFVEVSAGVFVFEGEIKDIFASQEGMVSNVTFVIGKRAVAVVDTGASLNQGKLIRQAIRRETQLPIEYVINTHVHLDHIFGNQAFVADAPEFVAHINFQQELAAKGVYYQSRMQTAEFGGSEIVEATRLISKTETINLGDRPLRLIAAQRAHTNHDLMVYDINTATLIAGDLVFVDHCPVIDGSLSGWLTVLADIEKLDFSTLVPGHGSVQRDKSALTKMTRYFSGLQAAVRTAIDEQIYLGVASDTLLLDQAPHWILFDEYHKRNVIAAYTELEWE